MNNVRTVSDAKRAFYSHHTRPISSIYRRVVDELLVEMHLLSVNTDFVYDGIYALGVVTSFNRFMQGYQPEADRDSIFVALCQSVGGSAQQYHQDATAVQSAIEGLSLEELVACFEQAEAQRGGNALEQTLRAIATRDRFKYSRLFGIGLYTLLETVDSEAAGDSKRRNAVLTQLCQGIALSPDKLLKDLDLYRSNLDKLNQAQSVMQDIMTADRKKRAERAAKDRAQGQAKDSKTEETVTTPAPDSQPPGSESGDN
ncbi:photosystem II biogenesis protein [Halomicronema hongdechloris C2206]|uniref:Protein Thf1 n=1 Tax=Halomicronema hongdechloris C2206 TaxID=1641165 RepID=A0A1V8NP10_9CYAN|nr:photosystem II biogenesis protein Psp29 [Halomicronema hongdechloris]ASC70690.1 photosystem II biogenesis protein [Halomicronema hongdechloris C2206]